MNNRFGTSVSKDSDDGVLLKFSLIVDDRVVSTDEIDWCNFLAELNTSANDTNCVLRPLAPASLELLYSQLA